MFMMIQNDLSGSERVGDWITTFSGVRFYPMDPRLEEINIADIAHSLSLQCRFAGHIREFYSVAQHSVMVANIAYDLSGSYQEALWGLMHDASEAYLVDLPRPIKHRSALGDEYRRIEDMLSCAICHRFGLDVNMPDSVKRADDIALITEGEVLIPIGTEGWVVREEPRPELFTGCLEPKAAEEAFLSQYSRLRAKINSESEEHVSDRSPVSKPSM